MASPTIHSTTAPLAGGASTSNASTAIGDLVVVITWERAGAGIPTHTIQSGYTTLFSQPHEDGSTDGRLSVGCKIATASGAVSYQAFTSSVGTEWWTGLIVLDAGTFDPSLAYRAAGATLTTDAVPNPPAVGVAGTAPLALNDYLFLAISAWRLGSSLVLVPTAPASYTLQTHIAAAATGDVACSTRALTGVSTTEDPDTYGDDQAPTGTSSITIAIPAAFAFGKCRQSDYVDNFTSGTARAYPQNVQIGSLLIAAFGRATNSTPTVTDTQGNTWAEARSHYDVGNDYRVDVWYAIAGSTGACTVTVTATGGVGERTLAEYQGPYDATPLDAVNSAIGSSNSPSSGNITPSVNGCVVLGYIGCGTGSTSFTPGTGFTADVSQAGGTNVDTLLESLIQSTAGAQDADCTLSSSQLWLAIAVSFQPPGVAAYELAVDSGSYAIAGTAAQLEYDRIFNADAGAYAITGTAADLIHGFIIQAEGGSYALTGTAAQLEYDRIISADTGSYVLSGTDASLQAGRIFSAEGGSYALSGTDATLTHGAVGAFEIVADSGTYTLSGTDAALLAGYALAVESGAYAISGTDATLTYTPVAGAGSSYYYHRKRRR